MNLNPTGLISLTSSGDTIRITLRRPPLNFLTLELLHQFGAHLDSLGDSPRCRALIIDSEGSAFCAGFDLYEQTPDGIFLLLEQFHRVVLALTSFARPTIAVIRGMAVGAGNELVACCDFALASERAVFGQPEIKIGGIPSLAPLLLPPLIGLHRAMELILTGNLVTAREAERIGLIHRALPDDQLAAATDELVTTFCRLSGAVLELALKSARQSRNHELHTHLRESESLYLNQLMELEDAREGIRAFLEKRAPRWKDR